MQIVTMTNDTGAKTVTISEIVAGLASVLVAIGSVLQWTDESLTSIQASPTGSTPDSGISASAEYGDSVHGLDSWGPVTFLLAILAMYLVYRRVATRRATDDDRRRVDIRGYRVAVFNVVAAIGLVALVFFLDGADAEADLAVGGVAVLVGSAALLAPAVYHGLVRRVLRSFVRPADSTRSDG